MHCVVSQIVIIRNEVIGVHVTGGGKNQGANEKKMQKVRIIADRDGGSEVRTEIYHEAAKGRKGTPSE